MNSYYNSLITYGYALFRGGKCLLLVIVLMLAACVPSTKPDSIVSDDTITLQQDALDGCTGSALTDSPFGNSSSGGNGLSPSTAFKICTATQFNRIGTSTAYWSNYFVIKNTLNFVNISNATFNRIGIDGGTPFTGQIDGKGNYIINVNMTSMGNQAGLIAYMGTGGVLKNMKLLASLITGTTDVGILVGKNNGGTIQNVELTVDGLNGTTRVGGLVGYNKAGKVTGSKVTYDCGNCPVGSSNYIGGAIGQMDAGTISDTDIVVQSLQGLIGVGGLVGKNANGFISSNTVNIKSNIIGTQEVGGLVGDNDGNIYGSTVELATMSSTTATYVGALAGSNGGGNIENVQIKAKNTINGSQYVGGLVGYNLGQLIDVSGTFTSVLGQANGFYIGGALGQNHGEINNVDVTFTGNVSCSNGSYVGGFIARNYGDIYDSSFTGVSVSGGTDIGGFIGGNNSGDVFDSTVTMTGTVNASSNRAGGLIGSTNLGDVVDSSVEIATVQGLNYVGGLLGDATDALVQGSSATITTKVFGTSYIGGLIGEGEDLQIISSFANAKEVTGSGAGTTLVGGLIGRCLECSISNSYATVTDDVSGGTYIGGLAGQIEDTTVLYTYAQATKVSGTRYVGGHIGEAKVTWLGSGTGAGSGSGYQVSYNFASTEVEGSCSLANCPEDSVVSIGFFVGSFSYTTEPFETFLKFEENYVNYTLPCLNIHADVRVDDNECNDDSILDLAVNLPDATAEPIEKFVTVAPVADPWLCDTTIDPCTCTPTSPETTCMEIEETYFMDGAQPPMSNWNFSVFWTDGYGTLPTLK